MDRGTVVSGGPAELTYELIERQGGGRFAMLFHLAQQRCSPKLPVATCDSQPISPGSLGNRRFSRRTGRIRVLYVALVLAILVMAAGLFITAKQGDLATDLSIDRRSSETVATRLDGPIDAAAAAMRSAIEDLKDDQVVRPLETVVAGFEVKGRLLMPDDVPAKGVPIRFECARSTTSPSIDDRHGGDGRVIQSISTEDGTFSLSLPVADRHEFTLDITPESMCPLRWTWTKSKPREVHDLGDIRLEPAGTIIGHVLDHEGTPLTNRIWNIEALHPWKDRRSGREPTRPSCQSDSQTATFELRGVPPGKSMLSGSSLGTGRFEGPIVDVIPGETKYVDLVCPDEHIDSRITVLVTCPPYGRVLLDDLGTVVLAGDRISVSASARNDSTNGISFRNLDDGIYTLSIEGPRFLPWSRTGISPGQVVEAQLKGNASVRVTVTDSTLKRAVEPFSIRTVIPEASWAQSEVIVGESAVRIDGQVLVEGLLPIEQSFLIVAPGYVETRTAVVALSPGETRALNVELSRGITITGRVVEGSQGVPVGMVEVFLAPYSVDAEREARLGSAENVRSTVSSPESGSFSFSHQPPGKFLVQAARSAVHLSATMLVELVEDASPTDIELTLSGSACLQGHIVGPPGVTYEGLQLSAFPKGMPGALDLTVPSWELQKQLDISVSPSGHFEFRSLPAGEIVVALKLPDSEAPSGYSGAAFHRGESVPLGSVFLSPGERKVQEFHLDAAFPGTVEIFARVDGRPASDSVVTLYLVDSDGMHTRFVSALDGRPSVSLLGPVPTGAYTVLISALDRSWVWHMPDPISVSPGQRTELWPVIDLTHCSALVRRKSDGAAVVSGSIAIRPDSFMQADPVIARPDENGRISLMLPAARYQFALRTDGTRRTERSSITLDWPLSRDSESTCITLEDH
jgi:hypothetical protein